MNRRDFVTWLVVNLTLPFVFAAQTWDALGCICRKIGAHWTICRKHWKDSTTEDFRLHLGETHKHEKEIDTWPHDVLMQLHDAHHEGGTFRYLGRVWNFPKPSKPRHYRSWAEYARRKR